MTIECLGPEVFDRREPGVSESVLHVVGCEEADEGLRELGGTLRDRGEKRSLLVVNVSGGAMKSRTRVLLAVEKAATPRRVRWTASWVRY
jgi:Mrp family chromosome partitioning ATPase